MFMTFIRRSKIELLLGAAVITLLSLSHFFPESSASSAVKAVLWGFAGTLVVLAVVALVFFWGRLRGNKGVEGKTGAAVPSHSLGDVFLDAVTHPLTWLSWIALLGGAWLYSSSLLTMPNFTWLPLFLWMLFALFHRARMSSKERNGGKEKKAYPGLTQKTTLIFRLAFLSTLTAIAYYALAPAGTWGKLTGRISERTTSGPKEMVVPKGVPLNPNFTSRKLANWTATYVAANPQYRVQQMRWHNQKLLLREKSGREVADVVDLTISFDPKDEALDIHLSGACRAVTDTRQPQVSKTCVGWWKDRGSQISGQFYLQVNEEGSRYFDAYLYDGNFLPKKNELTMLVTGPPIPAIMLRFRPNDWSEDKN